MPYYCTVPRCTSMAGKAKNVSFHQFPRDEELARLWNDILKRGKPYTKYSKVCSLHFKPEDYTITSVGKNKGQWRTLRKDAVPSQNLPSETPAPYSRKQWESWSQNNCTPNVIDPTIHQQMAQAIYMQTMLAMQAAGTTEPSHQNGLSAPEIPLPHSSHHEDILKVKETNDPTSYRCTECTKCFKDPDVFILHKRSHTRDIKTNIVEKENYNMNLTLRSNPILANLLKTNNEANFDPNMVAMENLLMTALAANMDYLRNFNMVKEERDDVLNGESRLNHARIDSSVGGLNHVISESNMSDLNHVRSDSNEINRIRNDLNNAGTELHCGSLLVDARKVSADTSVKTDVSVDLSYIPSLKAEIYQRRDNNHMNDDLNYMKNELNHMKSDLNLSKSHLNNLKGDLNHPNGHLNHQKDDLNQPNELSRDQTQSLSISYAMNFATKLESNSGSRYSGSFYRERCFSSEYEKDDSDRVKNDFVDNVSVESHCDNDLNESLDSNSLVIDESV